MQDTRLALLIQATDTKKDEMLDFVLAHRHELQRFKLFATERTGKLVKSRTGLPVTLLKSGPNGGDRQVAEMVASEEVQAVILLRDPLHVQPHDPDVSALVDICDEHQIPLATNLASASALVHFLCTHPDRMLYPAMAWGLTYVS